MTTSVAKSAKRDEARVARDYTRTRDNVEEMIGTVLRAAVAFPRQLLLAWRGSSNRARTNHAVEGAASLGRALIGEGRLLPVLGGQRFSRTPGALVGRPGSGRSNARTLARRGGDDRIRLRSDHRPRTRRRRVLRNAWPQVVPTVGVDRSAVARLGD